MVIRDVDGVGVPSATTIAATSGQWSVAVLVNTDETIDYTVLVDTIADPVITEALADYEFSSTGSTNSRRFQVFNFDVEEGQLIDARVLLDETDIDVRLFLRDSTGSTVKRGNDEIGIPMASFIADSTGEWSVAVQVNTTDTTAYTLLIDTISDPVLPGPTTQFEFNSVGNTGEGRFQVFRFDVEAGNVVDVAASWTEGTNVRLFLRDENSSQVARDTSGVSMANASVLAESSGQWSVAIQVNEESDVSYNVLVDTDSEDAGA